MTNTQYAIITIFGLGILAIGLAHHFRPPKSQFTKYESVFKSAKPTYFDANEKIGYSDDGRKWVIEERKNNYSRVWQIDSDGELLYKSPISPSRFNTRFRTYRNEIGNMTLSIADDSEIMALGDSTIIYFKSNWKIIPIQTDTL